MAATKLSALCEELWGEIIRDSPEFGVYRGFDLYPKMLDRYDSSKYIERRKYCERILEESKKIDAASLSRDDRITHKIMQLYLKTCLSGLEFKAYLLIPTLYEGPHLNLGKYTLSRMIINSPEDYRNYMARIKQFPKQIDQVKTVLKTGIEEGIVLTMTTAGTIPSQIDMALRCEALKSVYYRAVPNHFPEEMRKSFEVEVPRLIDMHIFKPLRNFKDFLLQEYFPHCRASLSMSVLPGGDAWYQSQLRFHCDTEMAPLEMHRLGLEEVEKLKGNIKSVMEQVGFNGNMREFSEHLRSREEFSFKTQEELFSYCYNLLETVIRPSIKKLFNTIPEVPLKLRIDPYPGPAALAIYNAPSNAIPTGELWFSHRLDLLKKYALTTLLLHETEPGHHYQACYTFHNRTLPDFRRHKNDLTYCEVPGRFPMNTAYTEGWGLYCEDLGRELGLYADPYTEFGFHDQNIGRAARIVADTGIHALGWSREQAVAYLLENTPISEAGASSEVTRYATCPGQACAYKYGHLRIKAIRRRAEEALGDGFDVRKFHEECLRHGQIPLQILEEIIDNYIEENKDNISIKSE